MRRRRRLIAGQRLVWYRTGWVCLESFEDLRPGPEEILVRIRASQVSPGTERANYLRLANTAIRYPHTPGYSAAGVVVQTGAAARTFRPGMRVAVQAPHASCAVVHESRAYPVPSPDIPDRVAALFQLGVIALRGVRRADISGEERLAVIGQGSIGLLAARLARAHGARVDLIVRSPSSPAARASCDEVLRLGDNPHPAAGSYQIVLDCTGHPQAVLDAATAAGSRGRIVLVGSNRGLTGPFDWNKTFARKELTILGAHVLTAAAPESPGPREEVASFFDRISDGTLQVDDLVGDRWDPHEGWRFYRGLGRRSTGNLGAWFDWTVLTEDDAVRKRSLLKGPLRWRNEENLGWEVDRARRAGSRVRASG